MSPFGKDTSPSPAASRQPGSLTIIARESKVVGEITGSRGVRVEGSVHGKVELKAALEVAEGATVEAAIQASTVRVAGNVIGNVTAGELVELLASARVKGDITAPALHVVEGAQLEGRVQMRVGGTGPAPSKPAPEGPEKP